MTPRFSLFARTALTLSAAASLFGCEPQFNDQVCESDQDCFPDEACQAGVCMLRSDLPDVDPDAELNACGGIQELENAPGDPCGSCNLDQFQCEGAELVCSGDTPCPETDVITTTPTDITARGAHLNGELAELPIEGISELGFCWSSSEASPTLDNANCEAIGTLLEAPGTFSLPVEGLNPGTSYNVATYFIDGDSDSGYGNTLAFTTMAPTPTNVTAVVDGGVITLSWDEADGIVEYEVLRDGTSIAVVGQPSYADEDAPAGTLSGYEDLSATQGTESAGVRLTWSAATGSQGDELSYEVVASYPDADSAPSEAVVAQLPAPAPTSYEVQIDDGAWIDVGLVTEYLDEDAPEGTITAGTTTVSAGEFADRVEVSISGSTSADGQPRQYRVRALADASAGAPSPQVSGFRDAGELSYQWQRTTSDLDQENDYQDISGATSATYSDFDAPATGETRFYRVVVGAPAAPSVTTAGQAGYRAFGAQINLASISGVDTNNATISATVTGLGDPAATEHGICISTQTNPAYPASGATDCSSRGAPASTGPFTESFSSLAPATTYFVRAFIVNATGTSYSGEQTFVTIPGAPTNLTASNTNTQHVALSWNAVSGAEGYRVYRDGNLLTEINDAGQTGFNDTTATESSLNAPTNLQASTNNVDQVNLTWEASVASPVVTYDYTVRAYNSAGDEGSASDIATGSRAAPAITGYRIFRGSNIINPPGVATSYADTSADPGTLGAPSGLTASTTNAAQVDLSWSAAAGSAGTSYAYTVRALSAAGPSAPSNVATGSRAAPAITGYEIFRDSDPLASLGLVTSYADTTADAGAIDTVNDLSASNSNPDQVDLSWSAPATEAGISHAYTVRALSAAGPSAPSTSVNGSRAAPSITGYDILDASDDSVLSTVPSAGSAALAANAPDYTFDQIDGTYDSGNNDMALTITNGTPVNGAPITVRIIARGESGIDATASADATGFRPATSLAFTWERASLAADPVVWETFGAADADSVTDADVDASKLTYRARVDIGTNITVEVPAVTLNIN
ncbi:fibronectin type III domain-containing protein [Lujinxingia sediminis]|uniref:Fibronectin type III domain-containing protein n=1 Tax=Lujinxingia sediminis TaxID=2480984 RepID=A0ABY0CWX4_9DELT|nr:fibronectin type III domain-containing protein [Lujinxingia sediminis]RVU48397.1 fibronectin type III domain-containing protein [Lujinxingia sediminis]